MLTKKIKTISLTALLLVEEETKEDKVEKQKNDYTGFHHGFVRESEVIQGGTLQSL